MEEDSPLLTPEAAGTSGKERERLLTPEDERVDNQDMAPPGRGSKRKSAEIVEPEVQRMDSLPGPSLVTSSSLAAVSFASTPSAEKYKKVKKVGVGAYGSVFMAENMETKETVAVKVTSRKEDPILGGFPLSLLREICILKRLKHENIVQILEVAQTPTGEPLIVMEYCQSSLLELLQSRKHGLSFSEVKYIIRQVLDATNHMHEKGILHRDLATKNVLFNLSGEIKVCDFGISRMGFGQDEEHGFLPAAELEDPNMIVSLPYRAIELLLGQRKYGPALDVWAAGCIMGEILLCQGGNRRTLFGGQADNPNKTPQTTIEEIFMICGTPSEKTWPGYASLPLLKAFQASGLRADRAKEHVDTGEEFGYIRRFFMQGNGKCANVKYSLTESCYDLLRGLLTLCPAHRTTAADALGHDFFNEKPKAEWHSWHWALASKDIARGDDMRKQEGDQGDDARRLLRQLTKDSVSGTDSKDEGSKSVKEKAKEALERRVNEKKQLEQKKIAEQKKLAAKQLSEDKKKSADGENLPKGWTKHWSSSKQRFYYHDGRSGKNQWHPP